MQLDDLRVFFEVANSGSLTLTASKLHMGASACSKSLRRLEASLGCSLFDRQLKQLRLNDAGRALLPRAQALLTLATQTRSEIGGAAQKINCRLHGPALLLWQYGAPIGTALAQRFPDSALSLQPEYEARALDQLATGDADFAIVTSAVLPQGSGFRFWHPDWQADAIGAQNMLLVAGSTHPLAGSTQISAEQLLQHDFACPKHSPFCGQQQGEFSDGWNPAAPLRKIRYWTNDLHILLELVQSGRALAYLPEAVVERAGLHRLNLSDCPYTCVEQIFLVHQTSAAHGWHRVVRELILAGRNPLKPSSAIGI
jgi:DNA-binding transcriptional LysR family regulator